MHKLYTGKYSYIVLCVVKYSANRWVFKCLWKIPSAPAEVMFSGKLLHSASPATAKARVPTMDSATRRLVAAGRKVRPPGRSATRTSEPMYVGTVP